ncbi:unnamed protein product [Gongylonema pulchrum]|uniref:Cnn_1N domain-containing protein n=1 Tax=Gongylonema pulchrum TaxID=637853 RepID=A0A183DSU1_9BILA|nr:unnamed protein product [Gongylonema pulchrum]
MSEEDEHQRKAAAISQEEFCRLQEQLIALRNCNYELLEENRRQQSCIDALSSRGGSDPLLSVSKLIGRKREKENVNDKFESEVRLLQQKLALQEEEFRLQQSTLLSELNKVMKHCELLEESTKGSRGDAYSDELAGMLAEKDLLTEQMKALNEDLLSAKKVLDEEIAQEKQSEYEACIRDKDDEILLLNTSLALAKRASVQEKGTQTDNPEERTSSVQNFEAVKAALEAKIKEGDEERKKRDEEMKVALKKQSSMVKELRHQVQSEKKRAEQAEKHLEEVLGVNDAYPQSTFRLSNLSTEQEGQFLHRRQQRIGNCGTSCALMLQIVKLEIC